MLLMIRLFPKGITQHQALVNTTVKITMLYVLLFKYSTLSM